MSAAPSNAQVYYRDVYWNDHSLVLKQLCRLISGGLQEAGQWWTAHFKERYAAEKPFERALVLNCGNGWVERELIDMRIAKSAAAFDYSAELLSQAEELKDGRAIEYVQADCNAVWFPPDSFDLVVNVAAMHHVQWIARMNHLIASVLRSDGLFINFDYVGPHRNQYGPKLFSLMEHVNSLLPDGFRQDPLLHPDLPQMMKDDPTEAIHSELILPLFERYFYTLERKDLFGAVAYQLMHNNKELYLEGLELSDACVRFLLELDELYGASGEVPPLFSFFVGRPRKALLQDYRLIAQYTEEEVLRETAAALRGGVYEHGLSGQD